VQDIALGENTLAFECSQGRSSPQNDQQLLGAGVEMEDVEVVGLGS
jgi:hypothetical protein